MLSLDKLKKVYQFSVLFKLPFLGRGCKVHKQKLLGSKGDQLKKLIIDEPILLKQNTLASGEEQLLVKTQWDTILDECNRSNSLIHLQNHLSQGTPESGMKGANKLCGREYQKMRLKLSFDNKNKKKKRAQEA